MVHAGVAAALPGIGKLAFQRLVIVLIHGEWPDPCGSQVSSPVRISLALKSVLDLAYPRPRPSL
jgi:hypothetical protein